MLTESITAKFQQKEQRVKQEWLLAACFYTAGDT